MSWKSKTICRVVMGGMLLYCSMSTAMAAVACSGPGLNVPCPAGAKPVSEIPSGVIDGRNPTFTLGALPFPGMPVRVFDNGIEEDITQYRVAGQSVTFLPTAVPAPGDVINVFYFVQAPAQPSSAVPMTSSSQGEVSTVLLKHAVDREIAHILLEEAPTVTPQIGTRANTGSVTNAEVLTNAGVPANAGISANLNLSTGARAPANTPIPSIVTGQNGHIKTFQRTVDQPRSLIMLAQLLRSTEDTANETDSPVQKNAQREISLDGVEGLGDSRISSPYDYLAQSEKSELDGLLRRSSSSKRSLKDDVTRFASMRMLVRRLATH